MIKLKVDNKRLKQKGKRGQQKYLVLLTNQLVLIGNEWEVMKRVRQIGKINKIADMFPTKLRVNSQATSLSNLIDNLNGERKHDSNQRESSKEINS